MSEDYEFSDDTAMMRMEEDGEANSDDPMSAAGDCGLMGGEAEGSRIDASKNEEDEGYRCIDITVLIKRSIYVFFIVCCKLKFCFVLCQ